MRGRVVLAYLLGATFVMSVGDVYARSGANSAFEAPPMPPVTTPAIAAMPAIAAIDLNIQSFIKRAKIRGASLAVVKDGAIVYARGYGYADANTKTPVEPDHLFRIASVSKLITATGIMQLVQQGILSLDQKVFGPEGILNDSIYTTYKDPRYEKITVKMLLNHSAGWSGKRPDPMFSKELVSKVMHKPLPLTLPDVIGFVFRNNLDFEPGLRSSYSNFGYVLLGEIISKVAKTDYETYIKHNVLEPLGITTAHITSNIPDEKGPQEVSYYDLRSKGVVQAWDGSGKMVPRNAGGNDLKLLGPAGGWVASSLDIAKLLIGVAGYEQHSLLSKDIVNEMTTRQTTLQPLGWIGSDNEGRFWRSGSLSGTSAMVVKEKNGLSWVFLSNTSTAAGNKLPHIIDSVVHRSIQSVQEWPSAEEMWGLKSNTLTKNP